MELLTEKERKRRERDERICREFIELRNAEEEKRPSTNRILCTLAEKYGCCAFNIKRILKEYKIYKL